METVVRCWYCGTPIHRTDKKCEHCNGPNHSYMDSNATSPWPGYYNESTTFDAVISQEDMCSEITRSFWRRD